MSKNLKKVLYLSFIIVLVFSLVGCAKKINDNSDEIEEKMDKVFDASKYKKEVDSYELTSSDNTAKLSLGIAKDLGFVKKNGSNIDTLNLKQNGGSNIEIKFLHTEVDNDKISQEEGDFDSSQYFDYAKVENGSLDGWQVFKEDGKNYEYYAAYKISKPDTNRKVYAVVVKITESESSDFEVLKFVASDDYKYLLHSMRLNIITE